MMWNDALSRILADLATEAKEDLVALWMVQRWVELAFPAANAADVRDMALMVVKNALERGQVVVGTLSDREFAVWDVEPGAAMRRLSESWQNGCPKPDLNTNVWLSGPDLGYRPM